MNINIKKLVPEAQIPKNATPFDTGYDLIALDDGEIVGEPVNEHCNFWKRIDYIQYKTGIQIAPQATQSFGPVNFTQHYFTLLFPRSSISRYNLVLANSIGLVDNQYRGEILLRFKYIWNPEDYLIEQVGPEYDHVTKVGKSGGIFLYGSPNKNKIYKKGDKIAQIAAFELNPIDFKEVENLDGTKRGEGGFGSSGK